MSTLKYSTTHWRVHCFAPKSSWSNVIGEVRHIENVYTRAKTKYANKIRMEVFSFFFFIEMNEVEKKPCDKYLRADDATGQRYDLNLIMYKKAVTFANKVRIEWNQT